MSEHNDGGPAFPNFSARNKHGSPIPEGMSLRDWFAGAALRGCWLQRPGAKIAPRKDWRSTLTKYADAMLAAREPTP